MKDDSLRDQILQEDVTDVPEAKADKDEAELDKSQVSSLAEINEELEKKLAEAEAQAAEYLDGWQRARAEFANARKRLEKDRGEAYRRAAVDYTRKLLPILDDFGRALEAVPTEIAADDWFEGLLLVQRKLQSLLDALNVTPIEALGEPFDPNIHEALQLVIAEDVDSGMVVEEMQKGYRMGDIVIRPSLVNVAQ